ncbi:hypothetical protein LAUMK191_04139 [Mycobacterium attenuatum]|uniref:Uncharacterized protein n=1 Tax=Mycobacterium attenuatum TaxID=2341086 RepID=A0A498Q8I5_9MYCO|nr:hypothetical protein LAUMK136_04142 [Mycobacterium attenuatum]VBA57702.1 hypothetical protein LAUMK191_04139 [Mycobacterium attenuatum]
MRSVIGTAGAGVRRRQAVVLDQDGQWSRLGELPAMNP